ncbi:MAG: hypothetical protein JSW71_23100 [Gemmatimonadota bacterium]|nr:MAG: hypothetical protein JSW71_23100 [Gemmatimonadota bacterium]
MRFREARTIKAIGELRHAYPYAAALLSYVVVERVLKRYVLNHWTDPSLAAAKLPPTLKPHGGKRLGQLHDLTRRQRLHDVLCEMTLGQVENLLGRPKSKRSGTDRNEVVHSNLYLKGESTLSKARQTAKNKARFDRALAHLRRALHEYEDLALVEKKGKLSAQPNKRMDQSSAYASKARE